MLYEHVMRDMRTIQLKNRIRDFEVSITSPLTLIYPFPYCGPALSHGTNKAQNGNLDSIMAYYLFDRIRATGLIGAFLGTFFQITGLRV